MKLLFVGSDTDPLLAQLRRCATNTEVLCWNPALGARCTRLVVGDAPFQNILTQSGQQVLLSEVKWALLRDPAPVANDLKLEPAFFNHYATQWNTAAQLLLDEFKDAGRLLDLRRSAAASLPLERLRPDVAYGSLAALKALGYATYRPAGAFGAFSATPQMTNAEVAYGSLDEALPHQALVRLCGNEVFISRFAGCANPVQGWPHAAQEVVAAARHILTEPVVSLLVSHDEGAARIDALARGWADDISPVPDALATLLLAHLRTLEALAC